MTSETQMMAPGPVRWVAQRVPPISSLLFTRKLESLTSL